MCGDIDEQDRVDEVLFDEFLRRASHYGVEPGSAGGSAPSNLNDAAIRNAYMEGLFKTGLARAMNDACNLPQGERMDVLAGQAIAFARLAGFIAGRFPPEADLFRTITGSLLEGHREASNPK